MKSLKRILSVVIASALIGAAFTGCGNSKPQSANANNDKGSGEKVYNIGIMQFAENPSLDNCRNGFIEGLKQEGFVEGKNVKFDFKNSQADTNVSNQIATGFVSKNVDMICAIATPSAQSAYNAAEPKKIPVVYSGVSDPVTAQLTMEGGKPGKTVTGTSDALPIEKQFQMIRKLMPNAKKIGIMYTTSEANSISQIEKFKEEAPKHGFEIVESGISSQADIPMAADSLVTKVDCINNLTDNTVVQSLAVLLDKANKKGIPVFGSEEEQVKNGCAASEGINYFELGIKTGKMAAKVLKGTDIKTIPYEKVTESKTFANKEVLEKLNIAVPSELEGKLEFISK